jgi:hypothetical protein
MQENPNADDTRFDRLVDGELSEEERRELLVGLDGEPGGWRRCALAFLEGQCWKQAVGQVANLPPEQVGSLPDSPQVVGLPPRPRSPWPRRAGTVLAMAASFLAALWLVSWTRQARFGQGNVPSGMMRSTDLANARPFGAGPEQFDGGRANESSPGNLVSSPWRLVTLSTPASGSAPGRSLRLPAIERDSLDDDWVRNLPPAIPDEVLQALVRTGHQVQQRRELVPVPLEDGRRLVVPVDQVEVHYTGNRAY